MKNIDMENTVLKYSAARRKNKKNVKKNEKANRDQKIE